MIDEIGQPHILMDEKGGKLWYHTHTADGWISEKSDVDTSTDDPVAFGTQAGMLATSGNDTLYFALNGTNKNRSTRLTEGLSNSSLNITADKGALRLGYLSFMVTEVQGAPPRSGAHPFYSSASVVTVPKSALYSTKYEHFASSVSDDR